MRPPPFFRLPFSWRICSATACACLYTHGKGSAGATVVTQYDAYHIPNTAVPPSACIAPQAKLYLSLTVYAQVTAPDGSKSLATAMASADPAVTGAAPFVAKLPAISVIE